MITKKATQPFGKGRSSSFFHEQLRLEVHDFPLRYFVPKNREPHRTWKTEAREVFGRVLQSGKSETVKPIRPDMTERMEVTGALDFRLAVPVHRFCTLLLLV